jgi:tetratricopeptide (TPR) repeat protein
MAPEQTAGQNHLVGSGTDIYALGCVLYELLTGRVPFRAASIAQTLHQIVADQPAAPSSLNPNVPADLETICLKCLRKEPQRRYENSLELANDLQRYGEGLPIKARPTPRWERGLKWCQRNPMVATLSVIGFAAVIAAFGIWIRFTSQLSRQTTIAIRESERAQVSAEAARQSAIKAENAAEIQAEVMSFLHDMTYELSTLDSQDRLLTALHASREKVAKRLKHRPLQMAAHLLAMGETYGQIGKPEEGLEVVREAMDVFEKHDGLHSKNTTKAKLSEISLLNDMRNLDEAQQLAKALDEGSFDFFTQDRWEFRLLQSNININDGQYQIAEQQLIRFIDQMSAVEQTNPLQLLRAHEQLGVAMSHQGRFQDAGPHFEKRLKYALENFPVGHDDILAAQNTYGIFLANTGRPPEAIAIFRDALPVSINKRGEEDKRTIELMQNMAAALSRAEQYEESHRLFRKAIDYNLEHFGQANGYTLGAMINLSADFLTLKQYVEGFTLLEEKCDVAALESMQHPFAGRLVLNYVRLSLGAKAWERAGELLDVLDRINVSLTSPDSDLQEQARRAREELEAARE